MKSFREYLKEDLYKNSYLVLDKSKSKIESLGRRYQYVFDVMKTFLHYMDYFKNASDMIKDFKIGLSKEDAIKLSKQNKPYNKHWEVSNLENEIKRYGDNIKINGPIDFYISFKNDKISKTYF